ncbi:O-antigen ligase family protein [Parageobacillus toebii]|uniref:O-antigen ligase-related domain-containing protein n=1 Tax=Parageobacillus toebii TaxID=153151 RepID=A0A150N5Q4_9BACL|nr:O-antigen ligase family protein [Parageobacillus toebii]KYD31976.1 hypothetical protein B4110_3669 [Parageobacillus toebii]
MENSYLNKNVFSSTYNIELNISNILAFFIGFTLWFPSFAIINIGNRVGVQIVLPIALIYFLLMIFSTSKINKKLFLVIFLWIFILIISTLSSNYPQDSFMGFLRYIMQFIVLFSGSYIAMRIPDRKWFIKGYINGALISTIYAIYQFFAFRNNWPFATLLQNNVSQPLKASAFGSQEFDSRSFAFTPEPSMFVELLLPAIMIQIVLILNKVSLKSVSILLLLLSGLVVSGSMSGYAVLFISLLILAMCYPVFRKNYFKLLIVCLIIAFLIVILVSTLPSFAVIFNGVVYRILTIHEQILALSSLSLVSGYGYDYSTLSRLASTIAGIKVFIANPFVGTGTGASVAEAISSQIPPNIEQRIAASSLPVQIAAEQGIGGLLLLFYLTFIAIKKSYKNYINFVVFIVVLVHSFTTSSGVWDLPFWFLIGMAASTTDSTDSDILKKNEALGRKRNESIYSIWR